VYKTDTDNSTYSNKPEQHEYNEAIKTNLFFLIAVSEKGDIFFEFVPYSKKDVSH
jgi:hypothetical protein